MLQLKRSNITLKELANRAGVSRAVASVVLNDAKSSVRVSDATRQRIRVLAAELDYHPNALAQGLSQRRIHSLGVLFSGFEVMFTGNYYAAGILDGIMWTASRADYNVVLFTKSAHDIQQSTSFVRDRRTDGFLVIDPLINSTVIVTLAAEGIPLVVVGAGSKDHGVPAIDVDNVLGMRLAVEHLLALGHTRIAHIVRFASQYAGVARRDTYLSVLQSAGVSVSDEYIVEDCGGDKSTYEAARRLLSLPSPPTAVLACNDPTAIIVMEAARDLGISVPRQLSVVGFDDMPASCLVTPALTTVRQPLTTIGDNAALLLLSLINGESVPACTRLLPPDLVVRGSTMPLGMS